MGFTSDSVKIFLAVLDQGSFSAAARALGRVPSAVSMAVAQLEAELDLKLFDRSGREPVPSEAARALEPRARLLAQHLRELDAQAAALHQGLEKTLTIAIAPELMSVNWAGPLSALAREFPSLEVKVLTPPQTDAVRLLHEGAVQLALVFERPTLDEREAFQEVSTEKMIPVIAPAHPLPDLARGRLRNEHLHDMRQIVVAGRHATGADPRLTVSRRIWTADSHLGSLAMVQAGLGWAYLPRGLVEPYIASGSLRELVFENMSNQIVLWVDVVWSTERPLGLGARRYVALLLSSGH